MQITGRGRWPRTGRRQRVDEVPALDIRLLARAGGLEAGTRISVDHAGRRSALEVQERGVMLRDGRGMTAIPIRWRPVHFGGTRPVWICPACAEEAFILYARARGWCCRRCARLSYRSQSQSARVRQLARANRMRQRLDPRASVCTPIPARPAGMHRKTYARWCAQLAHREAALRPWLEAGLQALEAQREALSACYGGGA